jgi:hypothetical protein
VTGAAQRCYTRYCNFKEEDPRSSSWFLPDARPVGRLSLPLRKFSRQRNIDNCRISGRSGAELTNKRMCGIWSLRRSSAPQTTSHRTSGGALFVLQRCDIIPKIPNARPAHGFLLRQLKCRSTFSAIEPLAQSKSMNGRFMGRLEGPHRAMSSSGWPSSARR